MNQIQVDEICIERTCLKKTLHYIEYLEKISSEAEGFIDEKTDSDLELKRVFRFFDSTRTLPGQSILYAWLRCQCLSDEALRRRVHWIQSWKDFTGIDLVRKVLKKCGPQDRGNIVREIWNPADSCGEGIRFFLYIWLALSVFAFASPFIFGISLLLYCVIPFAVINTIIHFSWHNRISQYYFSISYLARLLKCARRLCGILPEELKSEDEELDILCEKTKKLGKYTFLFINPSKVTMDIFDSILEYLRVFFLAELISYVALYRQIHSLQIELKRIFEIVGQLDASLSVHDFEKSSVHTCTPELIKDGNEIEFNHLIHPLIMKCISNSAVFDRGVILTGVNMAGKSTFLRTLGINHVLATTLDIAFCRSFRTPFLRIATSLQTIDSLELNQSHYYAEAKRLHTLWIRGKSCESQWLLLVDEVLSGTNSRDRNKAVTSILADLAESCSFVIATTHERDTAKKLSEYYDNYHFTEEIQGNSIEFDYKLRKGIIDGSNALRLLRHIGFPEELISDD